MKIVPWSVDHLDKIDEDFVCVSVPDSSPRALYSIRQFTVIPCGKCLGCRLEYAKQWSARLQCEYQMHDPNKCWFITLTYDDEHLPLVLGHTSLGEAMLVGSLREDDMKKFMKRLRKYAGSDNKLRFFYSAEYGSKTKRPHYHLIVYGLPIAQDDLIPYEVSDLGDMTWKCPVVEKIWSKGSVIVGKVTLESCAYVARYCMKKLHDNHDDFSERVPEFVRMSRRPGIGKTWLDAHPEVFDVSQFSLPSRKGSQTFSHPRYFMKYLFEKDPERYADLWCDRYLSSYYKLQNDLNSDLPYLQKLRNEELDKFHRTAIMKRKLE